MKNWDVLLINPNMTIENAIQVLHKGAQRFAMVVDEQRHLLGTITDGDIRRALIKHTSMNCAVTLIMNHEPKTATVDWSDELIWATIEKYHLLQLPIIDHEGCVIGLKTVYDLLKKRHHDNPVLLTAGGLGTRLHPLTQDCPKPLLKVGEKPILERILMRFIEGGFHRFFISTHFMPQRIKTYFGDGSHWGVSIRYLEEDMALGTGGALGLLPHDEIDIPIVMMNGDLLTSLNFESLLDFHDEHDGSATLCVREYEHYLPFGVVGAQGHQVISITEKPTYRFFINAGIYLLSPDIARSVVPGMHADMPDILQYQLDHGRSIYMFPIHEYWLDIGRVDDFNRAQVDVSTLFSSEVVATE